MRNVSPTHVTAATLGDGEEWETLDDGTRINFYVYYSCDNETAPHDLSHVDYDPYVGAGPNSWYLLQDE